MKQTPTKGGFSMDAWCLGEECPHFIDEDCGDPHAEGADCFDWWITEEATNKEVE